MYVLFYKSYNMSPNMILGIWAAEPGDGHSRLNTYHLTTMETSIHHNNLYPLTYQVPTSLGINALTPERDGGWRWGQTQCRRILTLLANRNKEGCKKKRDEPWGTGVVQSVFYFGDAVGKEGWDCMTPFRKLTRKSGQSPCAGQGLLW